MVRNEQKILQADIDFDIHIDLSPYQVVDTMHLIKLDNVFRMLKLNQTYVTEKGRLVGVVSRAILKKFIGQNSKKPIDRCLDLVQSFSISMPSKYSEDSLSSHGSIPLGSSLFASQVRSDVSLNEDEEILQLQDIMFPNIEENLFGSNDSSYSENSGLRKLSY